MVILVSSRDFPFFFARQNAHNWINTIRQSSCPIVVYYHVRDVSNSIGPDAENLVIRLLGLNHF